jgi:ABC-type glycerol-3-phosphate transport system permease component
MVSRRSSRIAAHLILFFVSLIMIVPLYWVFKTSLTGENLLLFPPSLIPKNPSIYYFVDVYYAIPFARYFFNSALVSVMVVLFNIACNSMAAFALRQEFPGKRLIIIIYLSCMMIPFHATIIPAFLLTKSFGLLNSHFGLAFPLLSTIICIFIFKGSFDAIPTSLMDAARMDGMRNWQMIYKIFLPLSRPAIATNVILPFVWSWNNFLWPLIIISKKEMQTLPLGLSRFNSLFEQTTGPLYAFCLMVVAPILLIFFLSQKDFISSLVSGAVKG